MPKHEDCISCPQNSLKLMGVVDGMQGQAILNQAGQPEHGIWRGEVGSAMTPFSICKVERDWGRYPMSVVPRDGDGGWKEQNWEGEDHSSHLKGSKK